MADRRYRQDEVEEIFDRATSEPTRGMPAVSDTDGLTLSEIQEVGREVGMAPARIAEAARALDIRQEAVPRRTYLGTPTSVGHVADLPRNLSDREWEVLVGELREVFGARGDVTTHGGIREWANGNLHVFLEPTAGGHRLRMTTSKSNAVPLLTAGLTGLVLGLALIVLFVFEQLRPATAVATLIATGGGGVLATNMRLLSKWAGQREDQMEYMAGRATALALEPPGEAASGALPEE
jgi:hypothetical protein